MVYMSLGINGYVSITIVVSIISKNPNKSDRTLMIHVIWNIVNNVAFMYN